jgi:hypothetical protein
MSRRKVAMVILCEDRQQEVFARHYLIQCGVPRAKIRTNICPKGKQAGDQYVRVQKLPAFDHEGPLEELAGISKNRRFDEVMDDKENEEI